MFGRRDPWPSYPKTIIILRVQESYDSASRNPRCSRSVSIPRRRIRELSKFQRRELLSRSGRQMFPSGRVSSVGRAVSRQAIFPLSRVTQPRRHNSFLHGAITTRREEMRREETKRRRGSRVQTMLRALTGPSVQ